MLRLVEHNPVRTLDLPARMVARAVRLERDLLPGTSQAGKSESGPARDGEREGLADGEDADFVGCLHCGPRSNGCQRGPMKCMDGSTHSLA